MFIIVPSMCRHCSSQRSSGAGRCDVRVCEAGLPCCANDPLVPYDGDPMCSRELLGYLWCADEFRNGMNVHTHTYIYIYMYMYIYMRVFRHLYMFILWYGVGVIVVSSLLYVFTMSDSAHCASSKYSAPQQRACSPPSPVDATIFPQLVYLAYALPEQLLADVTEFLCDVWGHGEPVAQPMSCSPYIYIYVANYVVLGNIR